MFKPFAILAAVILVTGCATHAKIDMPGVSEVVSPAFENKSFSQEVLYSQPQPGMFSGGEQQTLKPLNEQELSVASAATLSKLPTYIKDQLPASSKVVNSTESDFKLRVELMAHDKKGPAFADYEFGKSLIKSMLTFGFGSSEYDIIADFEVKYILSSSGKDLFAKSYSVSESVDHERGKLESFNSLNDFAGQLLEKHLILTLNDFFLTADKSL